MDGCKQCRGWALRVGCLLIFQLCQLHIPSGVETSCENTAQISQSSCFICIFLLWNADLNHHQVLINPKIDRDTQNLLLGVGGVAPGLPDIADPDLDLILRAARAGKHNSWITWCCSSKMSLHV